MDHINFTLPPPYPNFQAPPPPMQVASPFSFPPPSHVPPPMNWNMNCFPQPTNTQGSLNFSLPPPMSVMQHEHDMPDRVWIKNWSRSVEDKIKENQLNKNAVVEPSPKISVFKEKVIKLCRGIKDLEGLVNCLFVLNKTISEEEWKLRSEEIDDKKNYLKDLLAEVMAELSLVAKKVKKRKKKRLREKKKKEERCKEMMAAKIHREREHKRIDMWLEKMKEEAERTKREEQMKLEVDVVLSEVTYKKSEAKRTLSLLNTLNKLRNARVTSLRARGGKVSESEIETFNKVIEKLKKYWVDQLKEYNVEEQGLKVMLNDAELERSNVELTLKKEILQQWHKTLFGIEISKGFENEPSTFEELVPLRRSWDKFISSDDAATNIPVGWVIPVEPSNQDWATYLEP